MRYHTLFYVSFLPNAVFAHSSVPVPSGVAHHSSVPAGGNSSHMHNSTHPILPSNVTANASSLNIKYHQPTVSSTGVPSKQSTNATGVYIATSFDGSKHSSATRTPHGTYTKPVGALSVNYTTSHAGPTGTGGVAHSGIGVSAGFGKPTGTGSNPSAYSVEPVASSTGRLPIPVTKRSSPHFVNSTVVIPSQAGTGTPHTGTGVSSGFAQPTTPETHTKVLSKSTSTSGRAAFTKSNGFHFANSTAGFAIPTVSGHVRPTGASSGFAKPTIVGHHTEHVANSSTATSTSARRPFTKSNGFHFANSTSPVVGATGIGASGFVKPTNTRIVSSFPTASGHPSNSKPSQPQSNSTSAHVALPTAPFPSSAYSNGVSSTITSTATVIPTPSGHLPYTKSTGFVFSNSTSTVPGTGIGALSTKPLATAPLSTGILSTGTTTHIISSGTALPYSKPTTALFVNSTSSVVPSGSYSVRVSAAGTSALVTITEASLSVPTFATSSTQSVKTLASTILNLNSTAIASAYPSTGAATSTIATVPTTMITKASPTSAIASTGFVASSTSSHASPSHVTIPQYYQCGGVNFKGTAVCAKGNVCKKWNPYYHQCVDERYA